MDKEVAYKMIIFSVIFLLAVFFMFRIAFPPDVDFYRENSANIARAFFYENEQIFFPAVRTVNLTGNPSCADNILFRQAFLGLGCSSFDSGVLYEVSLLKNSNIDYYFDGTQNVTSKGMIHGLYFINERFANVFFDEAVESLSQYAWPEGTVSYYSENISEFAYSHRSGYDRIYYFKALVHVGSEEVETGTSDIAHHFIVLKKGRNILAYTEKSGDFYRPYNLGWTTSDYDSMLGFIAESRQRFNYNVQEPPTG